MTILGKILTFLVFLAALVWAYFTVQVYVTRTNWKNQAEMYKKALEEAKAAREAEYKVYHAERDALIRQVGTEKEQSKGLADRLAIADQGNKAIRADVAKIAKDFNTEDVKATELQSNLTAALAELDKVRARSNLLEDEKKDLTITKANADRDRQSAENFAKQAQAEKLLLDVRVENLLAEITELRARGGSGIGIAGSIPIPGGKTPSPVPEGLRGTVQAFDKDSGLLVISVGIDAGLTSGATLDLYREDGGGVYLGTVVIDRVYPKQAVAIFKPKDTQRNIKNLRPDELPKIGDIAGRVRTSATIKP